MNQLATPVSTLISLRDRSFQPASHRRRLVQRLIDADS